MISRKSPGGVRRLLLPTAGVARVPQLMFVLMCASLLLLAACVPKVVRTTGGQGLAAQEAREALLATRTNWSFRGRIALSQGKQGGSGRIEWRQQGKDFDVRLSAPITGQSWRLVGQAGHARLEGLQGGAREGDDAEALILAATGWRIPLTAMTAWVRGSRAAGTSELSFDPENRPSLLQQQGWAVEYREWNGGSPALPSKVFAKQGEASVRLVIEAWEAP